MKSTISYGYPYASAGIETALPVIENKSTPAKTIFDADASKWMLSPHLMLDSKSPIDVGATESGYQRVKDILISVKHGGVV